MRQKIKANSFIDEPICKSILKTVDEHQFKSKVGYDAYKEFALSKEELAALKDAVDRHYNCFTQKIFEKYPKLTYDDIDYCCLYLLGLKDSDISTLMQRSYRAVCDRNKKLKSVLRQKNRSIVFFVVL